MVDNYKYLCVLSTLVPWRTCWWHWGRVQGMTARVLHIWILFRSVPLLISSTCPFSKPTAEILADYTRKVDFLKGLIEAEKLVSVTSHIVISLPSCKISLHWISPPLVLVQPSPSEKALANQLLAPGRTPTISSERMSATKTVHMQSKARCTGEMRSELFGTVSWLF